MMEPAGREDSNYVSVFEHILTGFLGILILLYVAWHHKTSNQQDSDKTDSTNDFTKCQSPSCVRCHKSSNRLTWKTRLETFLETHVPGSRNNLQNLLDSFKSDAEELKSHMQDPTVYFLPTLRTRPWYAAKEFSGKPLYGDVGSLRDNFIAIRKDFDNVYSACLNGDRTGWTENEIQSGSWMAFHLYNQGQRIEDNCRRCPDASRVLEALATLMSGVSFGYACFSVLQPGSHITPHYGPCNLRVRCHLGLYIPDQCSLTVAGETRPWKERDCLLFDDSFLHEARNASGGDLNAESKSRAILMVDLWHPDLQDLEKEALKYIFAPGNCSSK